MTTTTLQGAWDDDPLSGLRAARSLSELARRLEALQVTHARDRGWSWQRIALVLGAGRKAVQKKHRRFRRDR